MMEPLQVGQRRALSGNVTTLIWIGPRTGADVEARLGYGRGRLAGGYWVALLKDKLEVGDFEFEGTTLRSGGRLGKPLASEAADQERRRVHDQMIEDYGAQGYRLLQEKAIANLAMSGTRRIAKIIPVNALGGPVVPDIDYPMGGGGLQWKILKPDPKEQGKKFLIAMHVDPTGRATTPLFTANLSANGPYEDRARVMRYLETA